MSPEAWNDARIDDFAQEFRGFRKETRDNFKVLGEKIDEQQSDEMRRLRDRADRPRQLMYALAGPILGGGFVFLLGNFLHH